MTTAYLPADMAALSVGAERVARALTAEAAVRGLNLTLVRTGSRGLFHLEPLLEVETAQGRVGYGPVTAEDVAGLLDAGCLTGGAHPLALGLVEELPLLKRQTRLSFARIGVVRPLSLADYQAHGGGRGRARALEMEPAAIVEEVLASGLRGRGGAGFPTGIKWRTAAAAPASQGRKYLVANADEGDSGTFADRLLLEGDPFLVLEGMIIAGRAIGARHGLIYLRSEYPHAERILQGALEVARAAGWLGAGAPGGGFEIELRRGAGAYVCGEETALLESLEGRRGIVRAKPPVPAQHGLFGQPTVVNNVLTLAAIPDIVAEGAAHYATLGIGRSRGTLALQLAGNIRRGGLYELPFGVSLAEVIYDIGGGSRSGRPVRAVQIGGPLGPYVPASAFDMPLCYEAVAAAGGMLGHGGVVVFDDTVDLARQARFTFHFCAAESCGKCTPCRIGAVRGRELMDQLLEQRQRGASTAGSRALLAELCEVMRDGSQCAMGGLTPAPVLSALQHFAEDFTAPAARGPA